MALSQRTASTLALLGFVLSQSAALVLHDHSDCCGHEADENVACRIEDDRCLCGHVHHKPERKEPAEPNRHPIPTHDADCPVCQLLAVKTLPVVPVEPPPVVASLSEPTLPSPALPDGAPPLPYRGRAPPQTLSV